MTCDQLLSQVAALGGSVVLVDGTPRLRGLKPDEELMTALRQHRQEIIELLASREPAEYRPLYPRCQGCGKEMAPALLRICLGMEDGTPCG